MFEAAVFSIPHCRPMTLVVQRVSARVSAPNLVQRLYRVLAEHGQLGVLRQAQDRYRSAFADAGLPDSTGDGERGTSLSRLRTASQLQLFGRGRSARPVLAGDLFLADGHGIVYLLAYDTEDTPPRRGEQSDEGARPATATVEVGYIGDDVDGVGIRRLDALLSVISEAFDDPPNWERTERMAPQFVDLTSAARASFDGGASITVEDVRLAAVLEQADVRQAAVTVRRAGNLVASDLAKRSTGASAAVQLTERLVDAGLLTREYVVVCGQSSRQVNRLRTLEALAHMADAGVLCSCGRPIEQEQVEELLVPTPDLQRMLDQSFWTTARLVQALRKAGVTGERIVLNRQEGPDEIDAFVDVHGSLLMFELKDDEFSMGHAYQFGGRIAQYRPEYAFIVATKDVSPDVKTYFERVRPQTRLVYVDTLATLEDALRRTATEIRSRVAGRILDQLDALANVSAPVTCTVSTLLQVQLPTGNPSTDWVFSLAPRP